MEETCGDLTDDIKNEYSSSSSSSLPSPDTSNDNKSNPRSQTYKISIGSEQGLRSYMEDEYYVSNDGTSLK